MAVAKIDPNLCDKSPACPARRSCPVGAITQEGDNPFRMGPAKVDESICIGCGKCIHFCPGRAITME